MVAGVVAGVVVAIASIRGSTSFMLEFNFCASSVENSTESFFNSISLDSISVSISVSIEVFPLLREALTGAAAAALA